MSRLISHSFSHLVLTIKLIVRLPLRITKWLSIRCIIFINHFPRLKRLAIFILGRFPTINAHLRLFAGRQSSDAPTFLKVIVSAEDTLQETSETSYGPGFITNQTKEILFPLPKSKRGIYFYVDHTIQCSVNTAIQRVTRQLGRVLVEAGENLIFVKWSPANHQFELLRKAELVYLSKWNGPEFSEEFMEAYPDHKDENSVLIEKHLLEESNWLIIPEVTHITYQSHPMTLDVINTAKHFGLKTAFVYYDAIPLRRIELNGMAENHAIYMKHLLLADLIIPISEWSARDLILYFRLHECSNEKTLPIINVVSLAGESRQLQRITDTSEISNSSKLILSVGSMEQRKNQHTLVKAFERYCREHPESEWKLILVGNVHDDVREEVEQGVRKCKKLRVVNNISDGELDKYYRECVFTVFPSVEEGFGLPILESLWYAKPCICADFGAMREVAEEGGCLMVDTRDADIIFDAIEQLTSNTELLQKLTRDAASRPIKTWAGYGDDFMAQLNEASDPLNQMGSIFYFIDSTCVYRGNSGIQRVTRGLARSLMENDLNLIPVKWDECKMCFYPPTQKELEHMSYWNGPPVNQWSGWREPNQAMIKDWVLVPELTHGQTSKIIQYANQMELRCAYIFYDAIPWKMKDVYSLALREAHRMYMEELNGCEQIFPISQFSSSDLMAFLGASNLHTPALEERIQACVLPGEFVGTSRAYKVKENKSKTIKILCVGTVEPRKNHLTLLQSFKLIKEQSSTSVELILAGGDPFPSLSEAVNHYINTVPDIRWEKSVDDTRLNELYAECDFTVYPSLEEGFGLPILESIWHARPCICRDAGAMQEVAEAGGCLMVETANKDSLAQSMLKLIDDNELRVELARVCTEIEFKTWFDYARELATRLVTERVIPARQDLPESISSADFYENMVNIKKRP